MARESRPAKARHRRRTNLKVRFGITVERYEEMHDEQDGLCAICNKPETQIDHNSKTIRRLAVDHCHSTKKVRGLLCARCNQGLGQFYDDPTRLHNAAAYIERTRE